jgi:hypothetical protein
MANLLTKISTKLLFFFAFVYLCFACGQNKNESKIVDNQGVILRVDSLYLSKSKAFIFDSSSRAFLNKDTTIIQQLIINKTIKELDNYKHQWSYFPIKSYIGNLDKDSQQEIIFYVPIDYYPSGFIYVVDKQDGIWKLVDFIEVNNEKIEPTITIDSLHHVFLLKTGFAGSHYISLTGEYYKMYKNSLEHILTYPIHESTSDFIDPFAKLYEKGEYPHQEIKATCQWLSDEKVQVNHQYIIEIGLHNNKEVILFKKEFTLIYTWNEQIQSFDLTSGDANLESIASDPSSLLRYFKKDLQILAKSGSKQQKYYLKLFYFDKYKK